MKLVAFAASNSRRSINRQLVAHAAELVSDELGDGVEVEILDLNDFEMPIFSVDRQEEDGIPPLAQEFFDRIGAADALLISYAEHNGTYTAAYKNVYDWASRIDARVFQDKPTVMLATSPGPRGASSVLAAATAAAPFQGADLRASLSVPSFHDSFDGETGELTDPELREALVEGLTSLIRAEGLTSDDVQQVA